MHAITNSMNVCLNAACRGNMHLSLFTLCVAFSLLLNTVWLDLHTKFRKRSYLLLTLFNPADT